MDTLDARFMLVTDIPIPPLLYLSLEPGDMRLDGFIELLHRYGLPCITFTPTGSGTGSWDLYPAGAGWQVVIGPAWRVTVRCPRHRGPVVEEVGQHAPPGWHAAARRRGHVVVLAGPARPFVPGDGRLVQMLEDLQGLKVLAGLVEVVNRDLPAGLQPPG